jgi:hypothetical protein
LKYFVNALLDKRDKLVAEAIAKFQKTFLILFAKSLLLVFEKGENAFGGHF